MPMFELSEKEIQILYRVNQRRRVRFSNYFLRKLESLGLIDKYDAPSITKKGLEYLQHYLLYSPDMLPKC